ncbi:MAG: AlkA N-terminal domain-containing protein [Candidatus Competibacteraceae bacterium]|jgi:AraC family transcriptional regulator of adaptative response / DNA-3-methyladenine glycosylase II|nr:AlkA N-terminal domain-containing protein [Candidatus Competibacteraceae bacterium]
MNNEQQYFYQALCSRDNRFDGRFFVGVTSTGIYCRPVCRVKTPKLANCRFFESQAAAETQGFRPCLRCRPELAPGLSSIDSSRLLARQAAQLIDDGTMLACDINGLANRMGVTTRHLRRIFANELGVSPLNYLRTRRLLTAKTLLTDTRLPIIEIASASGFGSLSQFNATFQQHYRLTPSQLRKEVKTRSNANDIMINLHYREPYDWQTMLAFLGKRALDGVEYADGSRYRRTLSFRHRGADYSGWIEVTKPDSQPVLNLALSSTLAKVTPQVIHRIRALFDLDADPEPILNALGPTAVNPGLRVPGSVDGFELAVRAVLGQQVSLAAARTLLGRLVIRANQTVDCEHAELTHRFPSPQQLLTLDDEAIGQCGITRRRVQSLKMLAAAVLEGRLILDQSAPLPSTLEMLLAIPGIGPWTANYIAMRALRWPDAFLVGDYAIKKSVGLYSEKAIEAVSEQWRPWRAYALMQLWQQFEREDKPS